ncbi:MAG: major capsid protein [Desulfobulbus sp.]|nr:major capsid protein [Desulfobulbus sp.]
MPDIIIDYFDNRILTGVINKRAPLKSDVFTSFFRKRPPSAGELFELHVKNRNVTMLPAITNTAPGTMRKSDIIEAGAVKAPRFRPKRAFMAADRFKMPAGVNPYSPLEDALSRAIAEDMDLHREEIDFALEIMCQQAMVLGKITLFDMVEGAGAVSKFTVDYKRPLEHSVILSGSAQWSDAGSDLLGQVDGWSLMIQEETGFVGTDLLLGKNAWKHFRKHHDVEDYMDNKDIAVGTLAPHVAKKIKGAWNGLTIWVIAGAYTDLDGSAKQYLDPDCALLVGSDAESVIEFGLPVDNDCAGPVEIFSKGFKQEDPSGYFTVAESRPLAWTKQPGWTVLAKVV